MARAWFIAPYVRDDKNGRIRRRVALTDHPLDFNEVEIAGDRAVALVTGTPRELNDLSDDARLLRLPVLHPAERLDDLSTRQRSELRDELLKGGFDAKEIRDTLGDTMSGKGAIHYLSMLASRRFKPDGKGGFTSELQWVKPLPIVGGGAFPTTSVLDDFNRADSSPASGNWAAGFGGTACRIVSNQFARQSSGATFNESYYTVGTAGPDCQAFITMPTKGGTGHEASLYLRCADVTLATLDGYYYGVNVVSGAGNDTWSIWRVDNGAFTLLGSSTTGEVTNGEKMGAEAIGSALKMYHYTGGSWTEKRSQTDGTYTAAGHIMVEIENTTWRLDDFGGGTLHSASATLSGTGSLTATATRETFGAVSLAATGSLTAAAYAERFASAALSAAAVLTAAAIRETFAEAAMSAAAALEAAAYVERFAAAALSASATLTAAATRETFGAASLAGTSSLQAVAVMEAFAAAALSASAAMSAAATRETFAEASLAATSLLTATIVAANEHFAAAVLSGVSVLTAAAIRETFVAAALSASAELTASATSFAPPVEPDLYNFGAFVDSRSNPYSRRYERGMPIRRRR